MSYELVFSLLVGATRSSVPLILASLGEIVTEKTGVVNIGIEGFMLLGGLVAAVASHHTGDPLAGLVAAALTGLTLGLIHGYASSRLKANQIVLGIGINLFAIGAVVAVLERVWGNPGQSGPLPRLPDIVVAGYSITPFFIAALALAIALHYVLTRTSIGLAIAACGENPRAAEAMGVRVEYIQTMVTGLTGILHGLAGAYLALSYIGQFTREITAGRGFIALAIVVLSNWNPLAALAAGYLLGLTEASALTLQAMLGLTGLAELFNIIPYAAAIVAVAVYGVKARAPSWLGKPYVKE